MSGLDISHGIEGKKNALKVKVLSSLNLEVKFRVTAPLTFLD